MAMPVGGQEGGYRAVCWLWWQCMWQWWSCWLVASELAVVTASGAGVGVGVGKTSGHWGWLLVAPAASAGRRVGS